MKKYILSAILLFFCSTNIIGQTKNHSLELLKISIIECLKIDSATNKNYISQIEKISDTANGINNIKGIVNQKVLYLLTSSAFIDSTYRFRMDQINNKTGIKPDDIDGVKTLTDKMILFADQSLLYDKKKVDSSLLRKKFNEYLSTINTKGGGIKNPKSDSIIKKAIIKYANKKNDTLLKNHTKKTDYLKDIEGYAKVINDELLKNYLKSITPFLNDITKLKEQEKIILGEDKNDPENSWNSWKIIVLIVIGSFAVIVLVLILLVRLGIIKKIKIFFFMEKKNEEKTEYTEKEKELQKQLDKLKTENDSLKFKIDGVESKNNQLNEQNEELKKKINALESKIGSSQGLLLSNNGEPTALSQPTAKTIIKYARYFRSDMYFELYDAEDENTLFEVIMRNENDGEASFTIKTMNDQYKDVIHGITTLLEHTCEITGKVETTDPKIYTTSAGKIRKQGNVWKLEKKARINYK